ncbi:MAG: Ig-like domain-containing protein, partial [Desulfuromusa sp.]|nr:Ig-like domain-containing protein [Desulfuromusa sp.]
VTSVGTSVLFQPSNNLLADTVYTITVDGAIKDLAGNPLGTAVVWNFKTGNQVDILGPQVLTVFPPDGSVNVPTISSIVVGFDEAIRPFQFGTIDGRPAVVTFNDVYTTVTMLPTAGLRPGSSYNSSIYVTDPAGTQMDEAFFWEFSTAP